MSVRVRNPDSIALPVSIGLQSNTSLCSETSQTDFCIVTDVELSESGDLIMEPDQEVAIHVLTRADLPLGLTSLVVPIVRSFLVQNVGFEDLRINSVDVDGSPPTRATSRRRSAVRPSTCPHACSSSRLASILGSCLWTQRPWAPSR